MKGAAIAQRLADDGYFVLVVFRADRDAAAAVVEKITKGGGQAVSQQADVSSEEGVLSVFSRVDRLISDSACGPLRVVVNNAGILGAEGRVDQLTMENIKVAHAYAWSIADTCGDEVVFSDTNRARPHGS